MPALPSRTPGPDTTLYGDYLAGTRTSKAAGQFWAKRLNMPASAQAEREPTTFRFSWAQGAATLRMYGGPLAHSRVALGRLRRPEDEDHAVCLAALDGMDRADLLARPAIGVRRPAGQHPGRNDAFAQILGHNEERADHVEIDGGYFGGR